MSTRRLSATTATTTHKRSKKKVANQLSKLSAKAPTSPVSPGLPTQPSDEEVDISRSTFVREGFLGGQRQNFGRFAWESVQLLHIQDYAKNIEQSILSKCRGIVTSVEFIGLTSTTNIYLVLQHCTNLRQLSFNNVILQAFGNLSRFSLLNVVRLKEMIFRGQGKLTPSELQIIDFFQQRFRFYSLDTLCFQPSYRLSPSKTTADSNSSKMTIESRESNWKLSLNILPQFLLKHVPQLKVLEVNRSPIKLCNDSTIKFPKDYKGQLKKFICNMATGCFDKFLLQTKLTELSCYNKRYVHPKYFDDVMFAIARNEKTLTDIQLTHKYIYNPKDNPMTITTPPGPIEHDMCAYKYLSSLKKLNVDISMANNNYSGAAAVNKDGQAQAPLISPGELTRLSCLPTESLSSLILRFDIVKQSQIDNFAKKFSQFHKLKYLIFHGNPMYSYMVKTEWVETLVKLPNMSLFEFHFCEVDVEGIEIFAKSQRGLINRLEATAVSCIYWKTAYF